ncbi:unnamed protein product [Parajaminaea phylloscopi]
MAKGNRGPRRPDAAPPSSSPSVARWKSASDIPDDEQERFHNARDQVLLNGAADRDMEGDYDWTADKEVLGLGNSDLEESDSAAESDADSAAEDGDQDIAEKRQPRQYKRLAKEKSASRAPLSSDDDDEDQDAASDSDDERDLSRWGANKRAYYNTNDLSEMESDSEIDEEQARELELKEVKKLQAKARRGMVDSDFGLGEADEIGGVEEKGKGAKEREKRRRDLDGDAASVASGPSRPVATSAQKLPSDAVARAALLVQLHRDSPETIALAGDFADAVAQLIDVDAYLREAERHKVEHDGLGMHHMHYQALATYVTTLTYYFHLRSSPLYAEKPQLLSQHPILQRLLKLKEGLSTMEQLGFAVATAEDSVEDEDEIEEELDGSEDLLKDKWPLLYGSEDDEEEMGPLEQDELASLLAEEKENGSVRTKRGKSASRNASKVGPAEVDAATGQEKKKRKRKGSEKQESAPAPAPLASLLDDADADPLDLLSHTTKHRPRNASVADDLAHGESYGEATSLSSADLEQKAAKKKSLRFYTGQMDAKEARRGQAARDRMGGDTDLPYRDRDRSRMAVEQAKAARDNRANGSTGGSDAALDSSEWGEQDTRDWRSVMGVQAAGGDDRGGSHNKADAGDAEDGYYDLVSAGRQAAKRAKKEEHDSARDEGRIIEDAEVDPGSHRAVNRQISTNRGLTPHRKQDRNLRVKKRKKYEQAQKKLSSTRAVYKGGQAALQGGYQGESSGINTGISKSRKFAK